MAQVGRGRAKAGVAVSEGRQEVVTSPAYDCCPWPPSIQRPGLLGERPPPLRSLRWLHLCSPQRRPECCHLWQEQGGQLGLCTSIRQQPQGAWHLFRGALTSMLEMHKGTALIHWKSKQPTLPRLFTSFRKKEVYCRKVPAVLGRATRPPPHWAPFISWFSGTGCRSSAPPCRFLRSSPGTCLLFSVSCLR